jgi:hypothetical protein
MHRAFRLCALSLVAVLLLGAGSSWKEKSIPQWNDVDAKQVLADSPWVKYASPQWLRDLSPDERRDSGDWEAGIGKGVGLAGLGILGSRRQKEALARAHAKPHVDDVVIRWESALPVRASEQRVGETNIPMVDADHYAIAVYDIQTPKKWNLAHELRDVAYLQRDQKRNFKPSRVDIMRHEDGTATVVYLFPRSVEITKKDGKVAFVAQIGRLFVSLYFYTADMQIQGTLEL